MSRGYQPGKEPWEIKNPPEVAMELNKPISWRTAWLIAFAVYGFIFLAFAL